jgi:hypothetical protein
MKTKLVFAVVTASALLGASSLAFAQAGNSSVPEPSVPGYGTVQQPYTTGSSTYEERPAPRGRYTNARPWQGFDAPSRDVPDQGPLLPRR